MHKRSRRNDGLFGKIARRISFSDRTLKYIGLGVIFGSLGITAIALTHAASYAVAVYAKNGTLSGNASIATDSQSGAGSVVKFGAPAGNSPPHILVLIMENESVSDIIGSSSAPYETQLSQQYENVANSYGVGHYSLDNYLGLLSGNFYSWSTNDCDPGSGCDVSAPTLGTQLDSAGISWVYSSESMPSNCYTSNSGYYAVRHSPILYFTSMPADCASKDIPYTNLISIMNSSSPPSMIFLSPNLCHDGGQDDSCGTIAAGDSYLSTEIPALQATNWYKNGGVIDLTYDEGDGNCTCEITSGSGNHIPTVVISAATKGAAAYTPYVNLFGQLAGLEKAYNLPCLGQACTSSSGSLPL